MVVALPRATYVNSTPTNEGERRKCASFLAMNEVYGNLFDVSSAEAATPGAADERASELKDQFIMDMHTHFLRDDTRLDRFVRMREAVLAKYSGPAAPAARPCLPSLCQ